MIDPYQLGLENDDALKSGAWWFYQKLGFEVAHDLRDYPEGHSELLLIKRLEPETG